MSKLDIRLEGRIEVIIVKEVLERRSNGAAGLPEIDVLDDQGRKHTISAVDLTDAEFSKIRKGAEIEVRIQEDWIKMRVL